MPFAITQTCCTDASCVAACPVNCIHPAPGEPDFGTTDMLYVDPRTCIDCGACADACPVDAVFPAETLSGPYPEINAAYYADKPTAPVSGPTFHEWGPPAFDRVLPADFPVLDVAVVGTGPAGMYAVQDLLLHTTARVTVYDRLTEPGGLVRFGVAPDHPSTKRIAETFARHHGHERVRMRLGVEVGRDVTVAELGERHDAVVYAVGASESRSLGIPGEESSVPATTVVGWYNGHPDVRVDAVDTSASRVVVVGTGNVALDVARILTADPADLVDTPIARPALERLRTGSVREVVLLARRGPDSAAYTRPELLAVRSGLVVDDGDGRVDGLRLARGAAAGGPTRAGRLVRAGRPRPPDRAALPLRARGGHREVGADGRRRDPGGPRRAGDRARRHADPGTAVRLRDRAEREGSRRPGHLRGGVDQARFHRWDRREPHGRRRDGRRPDRGRRRGPPHPASPPSHPPAPLRPRQPHGPVASKIARFVLSALHDRDLRALSAVSTTLRARNR